MGLLSNKLEREYEVFGGLCLWALWFDGALGLTFRHQRYHTIILAMFGGL